jgi:nitroreductase
MTTTANSRTAAHPIHEIFLERWSPRAYTGEPMPEADLHTIFEAARWAPSSYNSQPWRFVYARRDTPAWGKLLGLLNEFNQSWAKQASVLVIALSKETMLPPGGDKEVPAYSHSFDAGAAWGLMALQARMLGWDAHGMVGFDKEGTPAALGVPAGYRVEAAIAIGRRGDASLLPPTLAAREKPSDRKPLSETFFEGSFSAA